MTRAPTEQDVWVAAKAHHFANYESPEDAEAEWNWPGAQAYAFEKMHVALTALWNTRAPAVGGMRVKPRLTDAAIRAACKAHFGSDNADGICLTVHGRDRSFREGFTRMWHGAWSALPNQAAVPALEPQAVDDAMVERMLAALRPFSDAVFNDNGDLTVDFSVATYDDFVRAHFAYHALQAAKGGE